MTVDSDTAPDPDISAPCIDLLITSGGSMGLSVAMSARRAGVPTIHIIEPDSSVASPDILRETGLTASTNEAVQSIDRVGDNILVTSNKQKFRCRACFVTNRKPDRNWAPEQAPVTAVNFNELPRQDLNGLDVLVVGQTDTAVELAAAPTQRARRW